MLKILSKLLPCISPGRLLIHITIGTAIKFKIENSFFLKYIYKNTGTKKIACSLNENEIPNRTNDNMYFFFININKEKKPKNTYIESHCAQTAEFNITNGEKMTSANAKNPFHLSCIYDKTKAPKHPANK